MRKLDNQSSAECFIILVTYEYIVIIANLRLKRQDTKIILLLDLRLKQYYDNKSHSAKAQSGSEVLLVTVVNVKFD